MQLITEQTLKQILNTDNLKNTFELDMVVNTTDQSLKPLQLFLPNLTLLNLSNSVLEIQDIPSMENITVLVLKNCHIKSLEGLFNFPVLKKLMLAENQITELSGFLDVSSVEELDLSFNKIDNLQELNYLTHLDLKSVCLQGNSNLVKEEYAYYLTQKYPEIELDRSDFELQKRADQLELQISVNGTQEDNKSQTFQNQQKQISIYMMASKDLYCSPYSLLQHKRKFSNQK